MSICVNVERMLVVVYPLKTFAAKKLMIPASVIVAVAYNLPRFFELEVVNEDGYYRMMFSRYITMLVIRA